MKLTAAQWRVLSEVARLGQKPDLSKDVREYVMAVIKARALKLPAGCIEIAQALLDKKTPQKHKATLQALREPVRVT